LVGDFAHDIIKDKGVFLLDLFDFNLGFSLGLLQFSFQALDLPIQLQ
jgi:hypothetical protein